MLTMNNTRMDLTTLAAAVGLLGAALLPQPARAAEERAAIEKTLKRLVGAIRYEKYDLAAQQIGFETMAGLVLGDAWGTMPPTDKAEVAAGLEKLVRGISFPKGHEMFAHLDNVVYDAPRIKGDEARCKSTVVVHRNYKKTEVVIDWVLQRDAKQWKVVDTIMLGESTAAGIYEDQVEPLLDEGGVAAVLKALRSKLVELDKK